ncbi:MAG: PEP-CTERM sorting domain-containing protein, partial [Aeoliella sp.]
VRSLLFSLLFCACCGQAFAEFFPAVRDSIGDDTTLTNGLGGASAGHDFGTWATPGMVLDVPESGMLLEVKIVIFAGDHLGNPENSLANILGFPMDFEVWSDGIQGGPDSFFDNGVGSNLVAGHTTTAVNTQAESFITAQEWGITGPPVEPDRFTTFLITIDVSSFGLELQGGQQYVVGITHPTFPVSNFVTGLDGTFRQMHSLSTGFEDLYQDSTTQVNQLPGFLNSQHFFGVEQLAGSVAMGNGNYDGDNDVDAADYTIWRDTLGQSVANPGDGADGNGNGIIDIGDYDIWKGTYGATLSAAATASVTVPEPSSLALFLLVTGFALAYRRQH